MGKDVDVMRYCCQCERNGTDRAVAKLVEQKLSLVETLRGRLQARGHEAPMELIREQLRMPTERLSDSPEFRQICFLNAVIAAITGQSGERN